VGGVEDCEGGREALVAGCADDGEELLCGGHCVVFWVVVFFVGFIKMEVGYAECCLGVDKQEMLNGDIYIHHRLVTSFDPSHWT
jgi:hypothetical protein